MDERISDENPRLARAERFLGDDGTDELFVSGGDHAILRWVAAALTFALVCAILTVV